MQKYICYCKTYELKKSNFNFIVHQLNTALWGRQRQTLNGYFSVNNGNNFNFQLQRKQQTSENGASKK